MKVEAFANQTRGGVEMFRLLANPARASPFSLFASFLVATPVGVAQTPSLFYYLNNPPYETVRVHAYDDSVLKVSGTGFICEKNGRHIITTAYHLVDARNNFKIRRRNNWAPQEVRLIGGSEQFDVAFLETDIKSNQPSCDDLFGDIDSLQYGEEVGLIAMPNELADLEFKTLSGRIVAKRYFITVGQTQPRLLQIQMPAYNGISGSAVINSNGKIVGVTVQKILEQSRACLDEQCQKIATINVPLAFTLAVPINDIKPILDEVLSANNFPYFFDAKRDVAWLAGIGVGICDNPMVCLPGSVVISTIAQNAPLFKAGVRQWDVIKEVAGREIKDLTDFLLAAFMDSKSGRRIVIKIQRKQKNGYDELQFQITL